MTNLVIKRVFFLSMLTMVTGVLSAEAQDAVPSTKLPSDKSASTPAARSASAIKKLAPQNLREVITKRLGELRKLPTEEGKHLPHAFKINEDERGPVIGTKEVEYRYRIEKQKIPRYKYDYEEYEEYIQVPASDDPYETNTVFKRVVQQRVTSRRVVGHDIREVKVYDPNGSLTETVSVPEYAGASTAYVHHGAFGSNAMCFLAMLKCGLPADDARLQNGLNSLTNALIAYGAPDRTWDLAWLVALYSNLPQDNKLYHEWTIQLTSKLIAGANQEGTGKGFWGPVSINPEYLAAIVSCESKFRERYLIPLDQEIAGETRERTKNRLIEKKEELQTGFDRWAYIYHQWAVAGRNIYAPDQTFVSPAEAGRQETPIHTASGRLEGLVYDFPRTQMSDLESTAIALFALKEAAVNQCLPKQTLVPLDMKKKPMADPISTSRVLGSALEALLDAKGSQEAWSSSITFDEHDEFKSIPLNEPLEDPKDFADLPTREHPAYLALACASMLYLEACLDGNSEKKAARAYEMAVPGVWKALREMNHDLIIEDIPGRHTTLWHFAELCNDGSPEARRTWESFALSLLDRPVRATSQNLKWSRTPINFEQRGYKAGQVDAFYEASLEEYLVRLHQLTLQDTLKTDDDSKTAPQTKRLPLDGIAYNKSTSAIFYPPSLLLDSSSIAFIASGIRPPALACWQLGKSEKTLPPQVRIIDRVYKKLKVELGTVIVEKDLPLGEVANTPFLVLESFDGNIDAKQKWLDSLSTYLTSHNGTLMILADNGVAGDKFWLDMKQTLQDRGVTGEEKTSMVKTTKVLRLENDGKLLGVCIQASSDKIGLQDTARAINGIIKEKLPPIYFESDFPLMLDRLED